MRAELAAKKPLVMMLENWRLYKSMTECHNCNKSLVKADFQDSLDMLNPNTGKYPGQSHKGAITRPGRCLWDLWERESPKAPTAKTVHFAKCHCWWTTTETPWKTTAKSQVNIRGCAQCLQPQALPEPQNGSDMGGLPQLVRIAWTPADAGHGTGTGRNKMLTKPHREIHLLFTQEPWISWWAA